MSEPNSVLTISKHIDASPEQVFSLATDFPRAAELLRAVERIEMLDEGPVALGTRFLETRTVLGRSTTQEMEVRVFERPSRYALRCESHGAEYLTEVRLLPNAGGTRVELRFEARPQSFMAKALAEMLRPMLLSVVGILEADLDDLKAALEHSR
jgi:hypothetical protein